MKKKESLVDNKFLSKGENGQLSAYIFREIQRKLPVEKALVKEVCARLNLSQSAAYKKISGAVPLTTEELVMLVKAYTISLDEYLLDQQDTVKFNFYPLVQPITRVSAYFERAAHTLQQAVAVQPDIHLYYATTEITAFQYSPFPELAAFKALMWSRSTLNLEEVEQDSFRVEELAEQSEVLRAHEVLMSAYHQLVSIEFLTTQFLDNLLNHILYFAPQRVFADPATPLLICEQVTQMLHHQSAMAKYGRKFAVGESPDANPHPNGIFTLYHNEMSHINTHILFKAAKGNMVFTSFDHPNFLNTTDPRACDFMMQWFDKLRQRAHRISMESEVHRTRFFGTLLTKVEKVKQQLR
jgi:hypothetical protein